VNIARKPPKNTLLSIAGVSGKKDIINTSSELNPYIIKPNSKLVKNIVGTRDITRHKEAPARIFSPERDWKTAYETIPCPIKVKINKGAINVSGSHVPI